MNFYRVVFTNTTVLAAAEDTDMAVRAAAEKVENPGDLEALARLDENTGLAEELMIGGKPVVDKDDEVLEFIRQEKLKRLPPRRQRGMTLSYSDGDLFVTMFGYSASLACAADMGELHSMRGDGERVLKPWQKRIVDQWDRHQNEYFELNGWPTWSDLNEK